ncbi:hypothetical protein B0H11DRAFT_1821870 [Mycena galericulata]|nr:hypothetical protein B0H11DRAFT_1821870 [Mycena galericulata]
MSAAAMRTGPRRYIFGSTPPGPSTRFRHEQLDLQALEFVNLGKTRNTGSARLRRASELTADVTLTDLFSNPWKNRFALPTLCIKDGHLIIHSIVRYPGLTYIEDAPNGGLPLKHSCLTARQNLQFTEAVEMSFDESEGESDTSGGVPTDREAEWDDDEDMPAAPTLTAATPPSTQPRPSRAAAVVVNRPGTQILPSASAVFMTPPLRVEPSAGLSTTTTLPSRPSASPTMPNHRIENLNPTAPSWGTSTFTPESGPYSHMFNRADVSAAVYQAVGAHTDQLYLDADSLEGLARNYVGLVRTASASGDLTPLLSHRRRFRVLNQDGSVHSIGVGLERETIYTALSFFTANSGQWCLQTDEGRLSLGISMPLRLSSAITSQRLEELRVFGALAALALISGKPPGSLTPALFQYALNGQSLDALTPGFVAAWHPALDRMVRAMQAGGATGSLAPFQTEIINVLNIQISALSHRDENQHNTLVSQIVHTAVLGPELHGHPETEAFCGGLDLPCADGFSFTKFALSFPGGTEFYIAHAWTSYISDYHSIEPQLVIIEPTSAELIPHFGTPAPSIRAEDIFNSFLKRVGNPCPALLESAKPYFSLAIIDELSNIDSPSFRPQMFCWAATGSPFLEADPDSADPIYITFVLPGDPAYADSTATSTLHMTHGTISFRTCSRSTRIPMPTLVDIHRATYPTNDHTTFEDAVDSWFMLQILNAIGKVSML